MTTVTTATSAPTWRVVPDDNEYSNDDSGPPLVMILILGAVVGVWCCAIAISTKGCRDCQHSDRYYEDNVWVPSIIRDRRLALQLQREEAEAARMEAATRRDQSAEERKIWVKRALEDQDPFVLTRSNITVHQACVICLMDFTLQSDVLRGAVCTHVFHKDCITAALLHSSDCPVCRQVFLKKECTTDGTTNGSITTEYNNNLESSLEVSVNSREEESHDDS